MKKRIIASCAVLMLAVLVLTSAVLSIFWNRESADREQQNLQSIVSHLAQDYSKGLQGALPINNTPSAFRLFVLDASGAAAVPTVDLPSEFRANETFRTALRNGTGTSKVTIKGNTYLGAVARMPDQKLLAAVEQQDTLYLKIFPYNTNTTAFLIFILLLSGIAIAFLSRFVLEPVEDFTRATAKISGGDLSSRIKVAPGSEMEGLAQNFNSLADRLETTIIDSLGNQSQLEAILGSMNSGVIAVDKNNKIIIFNPFARKIFGIFSDAIGKDIREVIKNADLDEMMTVSDQFQELDLQRDFSTIVRFKTTELVNERSQKRGKVTVIQDVTDLKKLEQMRTQFVANVSHELKTPLTSIKGFTETLRDVEDPVTKNKFLDIIEAESERLRRLIEDILSLSSIENQERQSADIIEAAEATRSALSLLEVQARNKNIDLSLIIKGEPEFIGDADMYRQMIINLAENAIKYTEKNGRVKVRLEEGREWIILSVQDTGIGIPEEHLPRLFERFYRVDKSRGRAQGGTGLGLAIVKHIVITFGGTIQVESEPGKGTTFTVMLPAHRKKAELPGTKIQSIKFNE